MSDDGLSSFISHDLAERAESVRIDEVPTRRAALRASASVLTPETRELIRRFRENVARCRADRRASLDPPANHT